MGDLISMAQIVTFIACLVCYILVVIAMFNNGETLLGVVSVLFCGIGALIAFVFGWIKSSDWQIGTIMMIWTILIGVQVVLQIVGFGAGLQQALPGQ